MDEQGQRPKSGTWYRLACLVHSIRRVTHVWVDETRQRSADEVATMTGRTADGRIETVQVVSDGSPVANYGFDMTPSRLVSRLITERGVLLANRDALASAFPERAGER